MHFARWILFLGIATPAGAVAAELGEPVERALAVHVTNRGLDRVGDAVEALVPDTLPIEPVIDGFECVDGEGISMLYSLYGFDVHLSTDDVEVIATDGRLELTIYGTLSSDPTTLFVFGACGPLEDLNEYCDIEVPTTALQAHLSLTIDSAGDAFDVEVDEISVDISPINNPVQSCTIGNMVGTLLGQSPYAISDLILSYLEPELQGLGETVEVTLEDQLNSLAFETQLPLGAANLDLALSPSMVEINDTGIILGLQASVDTLASDCVDTSGGSTLSGSDWPEFGDTVEGTALPYDAGLFISKDFADQLMYGIWATGMLCMDIDNLNGVPLDAGFVGVLLGSEFSTKFDPDASVLMRLQPDAPPRTVFSSEGPPLRFELVDFGLEMQSELDGRDVRVFRTDVVTELGIDIALDSSTFTTGLVIDSDNIIFDEQYAELISPGFSEPLGGLVGPLITGFLPSDLLPTIALPPLAGVQIDSLVWHPTPDGAWQGAYLSVDTSAIERVELPGCSISSQGCGETTGDSLDFAALLGCDENTSGCGGTGCLTLANGAPVGRLFGLAVVLMGAFIRRKQPK